MSAEQPPGKRHWLDEQRNVDRLIAGLVVASLLALAADLLTDHHGPYAIEHYFGFYAFYGFFACVALVLTAKQLRRLLMRREDYYDR